MRLTDRQETGCYHWHRVRDIHIQSLTSYLKGDLIQNRFSPLGIHWLLSEWLRLLLTATIRYSQHSHIFFPVPNFRDSFPLSLVYPKAQVQYSLFTKFAITGCQGQYITTVALLLSAGRIVFSLSCSDLMARLSFFEMFGF